MEMSNATTEMKKKITRKNLKQNNWGRQMDEWAGRQNGGDHCCGKEQRKRNEKKWR